MFIRNVPIVYGTITQQRVYKKLMGHPVGHLVFAVLDTAIHKLIDSCFRRNDIVSHDFLMHSLQLEIRFLYVI